MTPEVLLKQEGPKKITADSFPGLSKIDEVVLVETAISHVVLVSSLQGGFVFKLRKHVQIGDLCDFTTLQKRQEDCRREIEKNRLLAPDLYLGVVPVISRGELLIFEEKGRPVDYAVKMRKFNEADKLDNLLKQNRVSKNDIVELAKIMAQFHQSLTAVPAEAAQYGSFANIQRIWQENFEQTKEFIGTVIAKEMFQSANNKVNDFLAAKQMLFAKRIDGGKILDGHGDLHSGNVIIENGQIKPFDALEFNKAYSVGDVASEIAFMAMDLEFLGFPEFSKSFVNEYVGLTGDEEMVESGLLDFYKAHRAWVRGKVAGWQRDFPKAQKYFALASSYLEKV